jgi:hypothetical protein
MGSGGGYRGEVQVSKISALKVVMRNLSELQPYKRNSRTHSDAQINQVVAASKNSAGRIRY